MKDIPLEKIDPEVFEAIHQEVDRERSSLVMIASENYASRAVIEAQANVMSNKYAEGYPDKRYYGGCEYVDIVEKLARERVKRLFKAEYVNVQPHSGSQANMAVYFSALKPGDTILGMDLTHGGHLTHGSPVSFSGTLFHSASYGVNRETQTIDFDQVYNRAKTVRPKMIIVGASAYPRAIDFDRFQEIAHEFGAFLMADIAHIAGLVAVDLHPSPVGKADFITSTTHKTLRGPRGGLIISTEEHRQSLNKAIFPGIQGGPFMHIIAAKAVCFKEALMPEFKEYQQQVLANAKVLADELKKFGFNLVSGGTDNHLILINLTSKGLTGLDAETALAKAGIYANKNTIPFEEKSAQITSGLRIGTPALTTRGMKEAEMKIIAELIQKVLHSPDDERGLQNIRSTVSELCRQFPIYEFLNR
ncbi:MAG: serine hydroxymethyltransferase [Deltaproteobacteria bacterium]|nr:serine hydroxymethyltransferase [Deltaproteobacteria bacterium]